jgi:hypothetical protein
MEPKSILPEKKGPKPGPKGFYLDPKKGSSKASPIVTAEEPF